MKMKNTVIIIIGILVLSIELVAQNSINEILNLIENNNKTLVTLRSKINAEKLGNKTGIFLENPEVEIHYLWSNPDLGERTDISILQSFDFPTAYKYRNNISEIKNEQLVFEYEKQLKNVLYQSKNLCYDLIYQQALRKENIIRLNHAEGIANSYKTKYEIGETNILEYNNAQLNYVTLEFEIKSIDIKIHELLQELTTLNGGIKIDFNIDEFKTITIPVDFEQWFLVAEKRNPTLNWLKKEADINITKEKFSKALSLPKFQAGYMSESIIGEQFKGIHFNFTIPLWENKNTVKYARSNFIAAENLRSEVKFQYYNQLKLLHNKAVELQTNYFEYKKKIQQFDNSEYAKRALDTGEISLIEYLYELGNYYESRNNLIEMELKLNKTISELFRYL